MEPTEDNLSFFAVYMCQFIEPRSVSNYLSGISHQLQPYFPNVRNARKSEIVSRTLKGCMKLRSKPTKRKRALSRSDMEKVTNQLGNSQDHDDLLFVAMIVTGFFALLRLGEMTLPDEVNIQDWRKIARRNSVKISKDAYEFTLPAHKADRFFEGNHIMIRSSQPFLEPRKHFVKYIASRDHLLALASPLWIRKDGSPPTRSWFMKRLRSFFDSSVGGQSMRAGGATLLAEMGASPSLIQASGRWSSEAFLIYIRKHPAVLQGMLYTNPKTGHISPS